MKVLSKLCLLTLLTLLVVFLPAQNAVEATSPTGGALFEPPDGTKLLIIGQDIDSFDAYVAGVGVIPGGHVTYTSINDQEGIHSPKDHGAGTNYLDYLAATYPESTIEIAIWIKGQLQNIVDNTRWGKVADYNERMDTLIDCLVAYNRPVFMRWGYEFDGPWNENDPELYKAAWIRMWDRITLKGAHDKIAMVWQGAAWSGGTYMDYPIEAWYPGDQYVDWVGISIFAPQDNNWASVQELTDFAYAHNKPMLICESAPQRYDLDELTYSPNLDGSDKVSKTAEEIWNEWFVPYFNYIDNVYPNLVKGVTYINADWDSQRMWGPPYRSGYWGDSRVQVNPTILNNWLGIITGDDYWNASPTLFSDLGYPGF